MRRSQLSALPFFCMLLYSPLAHAQIIITGRYSEVWYNSVNLTDGVPPSPPSTAIISTTNLTAPFVESLSAQFDHFTVTGAHNTGHLLVSQNTIVSTASVSSDVSQSGWVATDTDSPAIYTNSEFYLEFVVPQVTYVTLTGSIFGSSIVGQQNFARVELKQDNGPIFNSAWNPFPFVGTLHPNFTYSLLVEASGYAAFNDSTNSSASANLVFAAVPEPSTMLLSLTGLGSIIPFVLRRTRVARVQQS